MNYTSQCNNHSTSQYNCALQRDCYLKMSIKWKS